jgi:hypothetical protein
MYDALSWAVLGLTVLMVLALVYLATAGLGDRPPRQPEDPPGPPSPPGSRSSSDGLAPVGRSNGNKEERPGRLVG